MSFKEYTDAIEKANDKIILKEASKTQRKGAARLRDRLVFGKVSWGEALTYLAIVQTGIIFFGLLDDVIVNVNSFFTMIGISFQFPVGASVLFAFVFIVTIFVFGLLAVRHIGTYRSSLELGAKMNPAQYLLWEELQDVKQKLNKLEEKKK